MKTLNFEQGSEEWFSYRAGKPTTSNFDKIVTSTGKKSAQFDKYAYRCAYESVTQKREESYQNDVMKRGIELEPEARFQYEFIMGYSDGECGIVTNDESTVSCSPDGLYGKVGLEIKSPYAETHVGYLVKGVLPTTYKHQVYGCLWICDEIDCWDFFSYHPDMKHFLIRTDKDDKQYKTYADALDKYIPEFLNLVESVKEILK